MLITSLLPLLGRYSLSLSVVAGPDSTVTLTVIPSKAPGATANLEGGELRPISITATAAEIDAELAKGADGALGQLITARKALGDQLAEHRAAAEAAKSAAAAKPKPAAKATPAPATPASAAQPADAGVPAALWD